MPPAVFVGHVNGVGGVGIRIVELFVAVAEIVFAEIVRRVDVDDVDLARISRFERRQYLQVVALDKNVGAFRAIRIGFYGL